MGKSIDLPDPLESASSQPLGNADDLLAQLAGEEVDRLLAEADDGKQQSPADDAGAADVAPAKEPPVQEQLDALFSEIATEQSNLATTTEATPAPAPLPAPISAPAPVAPIAPSTSKFAVPAPRVPNQDDDAPNAQVLGKLPADVNANELMAAILGDPEQMGKLPDFSPPPPVPAALLAAAAAKSNDLQTSAAERQGLATTDPADELPGPGELAALTGTVEEDAPLPAYLKPLEWLNAPLEMLPQTARDVLGQVAILTLVNAIAVLIYVFVFRKS
jgi:hypothetical protein